MKQLTSSILQAKARRGFSLVEILVTVGLLSIIVLGLLAMFNQTQRAFRSSMTQTDVLEAGRSFSEMLQREMVQMTPSYASNCPNFLAEIARPSRMDAAFQPVVFLQDLPGSAAKRENVFEHFFFLTRENRDWTGIGYVVGTPEAGIGTLYRFEASTRYDEGLLAVQFRDAVLRLYRGNVVSSNLTRIADGVAHMRVKPLDRYGYEYGNSGGVVVAFPGAPAVPGLDMDYFFYSNAVPAFVEIEVGFLEDRTLARLRSIPDAVARSNFLRDHAGQVHLFRQAVPIRNVDYSAYP